MPSIYLHFHVNLLFDDVTEFICCPIYQFVAMSILVFLLFSQMTIKNVEKILISLLYNIEIFLARY